MRLEPLSGKSCDDQHPFPAPDEGSWIDSMEYGELERLLPRMNDRDPTVAWRMIAANLWGTPCYGEHASAVAADPILTTHVIAVSAVASPPERADPITRLGFDQAGAGAVFAALRSGGLEEGRQTVETMHPSVRKNALNECVAHINHGFTAMRLDVGAHFPS